MPVGRLGDDVVQEWFDLLMEEDLWASLFFANPFSTDPTSVEVLGGSYQRYQITKDRLAFNLIRNANLLQWLNLSPGTNIVAVGAFDAEISGSLRAASMLDDPVALPSGGTWSLPVHEFQIGLDVVLGP